ncbi:MAG: hypothetical protein R3321_14185 [Nitrososphaeraceae archaeon]|nr:hypothetical protein [Nitrososphaeraceae archaeon]
MSSTTKIGSMILLAAVLVVGTVAMTIPSSFAEPEYREYKDPYAKEYKSYGDPYEKKDPYYMKDDYNKKDPFGKEHDKEYKGASIQKIKCVNSNVNINDVDVGKYANGLGADATTAEALQGDENGLTQGTGNGISGNGGIDIERNLVNICLDINLNAQNDELLGLLF